MVKNGVRWEMAPPRNCWKARPPNQLFTSGGVPEMMPWFFMSITCTLPSVSPKATRSKKLSKSVSISETGAATGPRLRRGSQLAPGQGAELLLTSYRLYLKSSVPS